MQFLFSMPGMQMESEVETETETEVFYPVGFHYIQWYKTHLAMADIGNIKGNQRQRKR